MNKVHVNPQQKSVGAIVRKALKNDSNGECRTRSIFQMSMFADDICDVILPGMDLIPLDE